jgi:hypothetical protein
MKKVALAKCLLVSWIVLASGLATAQQTFRTTNGSVIGYMEYLPTDYNSNSDKYPLVVFLHGVDERGVTSTDPATLQTTISLATKLGPPAHVKNGAQFPFILITPQLKNSYGSWPSSYVKEVIEYCKTYLRVDEKRIHVTGLSMGGHGTWTCAEDLPSVFASAAPVCGANNTPSKACGIASENVAIWAFHGDADPVVSYTRTTKMVDAINACSPAPTPLAKATIYAGIQHNAWYRAYFLDNNYHNPNYYQWVMLQKKNKKGTNAIPTANAGSDISIASPTSTTIITGSASDTDGSISAYKWTQIKGPTTATLSGTTTNKLTVSGLVLGTYVFKLQVTDNGGLIDSDFVSVTVTGTGNILPIVNAGMDKVISLPTNSVTLTGSATDANGTISSYSWTKVSGGSATLSGATTTTLSVTGLVAGDYIFRLSATDNSGGVNYDEVLVEVNSPPTVSAGPDLTVTLPTNSVAIQGTASDADGSIQTYSWAKTSGSSATLSGTTTSKLSATGLVTGTYIFRLTVKDNAGASKSDDVTVTVSSSGAVNVVPVANAGADKTITLPTNSVSIAGSATDSDGTIATYSWSKVSGGNATLSGATTSTLSASGMVAGAYVFRLSVTDNNGGNDTDDVTVTVNNAPTVSAGSDITITLPTNSVSIQGTASDSDGSIASYDWTMTTGTTATLSGTTTSRLTASGLTQGTYVFRLTVKDNSGASKYDDVQVTVAPSTTPNTAPVAAAGADRVITLPANSISITGTGTDSDGTISTYSWSKVSGGSATLSGNTTATLSSTGMVAGNYVFRLIVTDDKGATGSDDVNVFVNNAPTVSAGADFSVTLPISSISAQGTASDSDGTIASYSWALLTGPSATLSGTTTSKLTATDLLAGAYVFRLTVKDNSGASKYDDIKITVNPSPNVAPVANAGSDLLISLPTASVNITGSGTDADGTISAYSWNQVSGGAATLSGTNAQTLTASALAQGAYVFRLTVTDNGGGTASDDITVIVNSPPTVFAGADFKITLPTNSVNIQGDATDPDGTITSYKWAMLTGTVATLSGTDTRDLSATGLVEGPYVFRLTVTDDRGAKNYDDIKIVVNPSSSGNTIPNVLPVASAGNDLLISMPTNAVTLVGSGSDSDGSVSGYSWTKVSGGAATLTGATTSTLNASDLVAGTYIFRLTVTDNSGGQATDDVAVSVNAQPIVSVGADFKITLPVNSLSVQGTASDPDGTIASYAWKMTTGVIANLSGTTTSKLTATGLVEGAYVFRMTVKDNNGASKHDDVKIFVLPDLTNAAPVANAGADKVVTLPANSVTLIGSATDANGTITAYYWEKISGGAATITGTMTNSLSVAGLEAGIYVFRLTAVDNGNRTGTDEVTVIVNQPPVVSAGADFSLTLPANSLSVTATASDPDGTIASYSWKMTTGTVATLTGTTTATLSATGLIEGSYVFRCTVKDNDGAYKFDDVKIIVKPAPTTGTSFEPSVEMVDLDASSESDDNARDLKYDNENYWKDKKVVIYDGTGKLMYAGAWSAQEYHTQFETGRLYIFNILEKGRKIKQGKIFILN